MRSNEVSLFPELTTVKELAHTTGTLPSQTIRELIRTGRISAPLRFGEDQIQPASIDLRLGPGAYRGRASFLPGRHSTVDKKIKEFQIEERDLTKPTVFDRGPVFILPLLEEASLPPDTLANANPKSTTGRLDIFTRLIRDYRTGLDWFRNG